MIRHGMMEHFFLFLLLKSFVVAWQLLLEQNHFQVGSKLVSWCFEPSQPQRITSGIIGGQLHLISSI